MIKRKFTTKKVISSQPMAFKKWEEWNEGDYVVGKYVKDHQDSYKKINPVLEVAEASFDISQKLICLNTCGSLTKAMAEVSIGEYVQVTYTGKAKIAKGIYAGKEAHSVQVELMTLDDEEEVEADDYEL